MSWGRYPISSKPLRQPAVICMAFSKRFGSRFWSWTGDLKVISANESFYRKFLVSENVVIKKSIFELGNGQWDIPELRQLLEKVLPEKESFEDFEMEHVFPEIGKKKMRLNARIIHEGGVAKERILLAIEDVTGEEGC